MANIANIIKSLQNIMWKDPGVSGDAQRLEQLGWMITLKILDDKDAELELLNDDYGSEDKGGENNDILILILSYSRNPMVLVKQRVTSRKSLCQSNDLVRARLAIAYTLIFLLSSCFSYHSDYHTKC